MEEEGQKHIENHFEAGSNCQVFNGPISGCVFAMPGATVTQQASPPKENNDEEVEYVAPVKEEELLERLKPLFFNNEDDVRLFLKEIAGMPPNDITDLVNRWVQDKRISDYGNSRKGVLWEILKGAGLYTRSRQNWNRRVY